MATPKFKQRCAMCKKNMVVMYSGRQFPKCVPCEMKEITDPIEDETMRALFDIPLAFYEKSHFLRNIKRSYIRFGELTEKQISSFEEVVKDMKANKDKEQEAD